MLNLVNSSDVTDALHHAIEKTVYNELQLYKIKRKNKHENDDLFCSKAFKNGSSLSMRRYKKHQSSKDPKKSTFSDNQSYDQMPHYSFGIPTTTMQEDQQPSLDQHRSLPIVSGPSSNFCCSAQSRYGDLDSNMWLNRYNQSCHNNPRNFIHHTGQPSSLNVNCCDCFPSVCFNPERATSPRPFSTIINPSAGVSSSYSIPDHFHEQSQGDELCRSPSSFKYNDQFPQCYNQEELNRVSVTNFRHYNTPCSQDALWFSSPCTNHSNLILMLQKARMPNQVGSVSNDNVIQPELLMQSLPSISKPACEKTKMKETISDVKKELSLVQQPLSLPCSVAIPDCPPPDIEKSSCTFKNKENELRSNVLAKVKSDRITSGRAYHFGRHIKRLQMQLNKRHDKKTKLKASVRRDMGIQTEHSTEDPACLISSETQTSFETQYPDIQTLTTTDGYRTKASDSELASSLCLWEELESDESSKAFRGKNTKFDFKDLPVLITALEQATTTEVSADSPLARRDSALSSLSESESEASEDLFDTTRRDDCNTEPLALVNESETAKNILLYGQRVMLETAEEFSRQETVRTELWDNSANIRQASHLDDYKPQRRAQQENKRKVSSNMGSRLHKQVGNEPEEEVPWQKTLRSSPVSNLTKKDGLKRPTVYVKQVKKKEFQTSPSQPILQTEHRMQSRNNRKNSLLDGNWVSLVGTRLAEVSTNSPKCRTQRLSLTSLNQCPQNQHSSLDQVGSSQETACYHNKPCEAKMDAITSDAQSISSKLCKAQKRILKFVPPRVELQESCSSKKKTKKENLASHSELVTEIEKESTASNFDKKNPSKAQKGDLKSDRGQRDLKEINKLDDTYLSSKLMPLNLFIEGEIESAKVLPPTKLHRINTNRWLIRNRGIGDGIRSL